MRFERLLGQEFIKKHLQQSARTARASHAQLFVGEMGTGLLPMAIAYARALICSVENQEGCDLQFDQLAHPDLHFVFPVATTTAVKSKPVSSLFLKEWRDFVQNNAYANLFDWHQHLDIEKKQAQIGVDEAQAISKALSLKSYEGGYKVVIIWMAEKMNAACANKLLKLLEEPPEKTVFLLLAQQEDLLIDTIRSRCQTLHFPKLPETVIANALVQEHNCESDKAHKIAFRAQGNYNTALRIFQDYGYDTQFETWFVDWVRLAFSAKGKKSAVLDLIAWSETIAKAGRETQKNFIDYCTHFFRQAFLLNYKVPKLVYLQPQTSFKLEKFAPFVHGNNILDIYDELQEASYHISRNGNTRIIMTDLSLKLTRLLHSK